MSLPGFRTMEMSLPGFRTIEQSASSGKLITDFSEYVDLYCFTCFLSGKIYSA